MGKIRLIALDLDGTALDGGGCLTPRTKRAVESAIEGGIFVVVAIGRPYAALPREVMEIKGIASAIVSNGAAAYDPATDERIYSLNLPADKVLGLLGILDAFPETMIEVYVEGTPFADAGYVDDPAAYGLSGRSVDYIRRTRTPVGDIRAFAYEHAQELDAFDIIVRGDAERKLWRERVQGLGGIYITSSTANRLELSNENGGKAAALRWTAHLLGVKPEEIIAFGNGENDVDMIRFAGTGYAVAGSDRALIEAADKMAPSNAEDGVAVVLEGLESDGWMI